MNTIESSFGSLGFKEACRMNYGARARLGNPVLLPREAN